MHTTALYPAIISVFPVALEILSSLQNIAAFIAGFPCMPPGLPCLAVLQCSGVNNQ